MKKFIIAFLIGFFVLTSFYFFSKNQKVAEKSLTQKNISNEIVAEDSMEKINLGESAVDSIDRNNFVAPLNSAKERINKKPFGIFITKENSPVQPERFSGYHTGTDFEIFPEELNVEIPVKAICDGKILKKERVNGYGGVLAQSCQIDKNLATVLYGHLSLSSIDKEVGADLVGGEIIGNLGRDKSVETDGERKHLHLAVHGGTTINFLGYVADRKNLSRWIDVCGYVCK